MRDVDILPQLLPILTLFALSVLCSCLYVPVCACQMRQSFVRVDGNRLRIQNGKKDFDVLLDQLVTLRCMEKDGNALLELHNVCKPPKAFSRIMSARMSLRLHFTSVENRDCWFTVLKLANAIPQPCQHWYSGEWREESVVFRSKVTDGRSGTWLEVLTRNTWPEEGDKAASDHSLRSLVLEPMRVDISQPGAPYLERDAGMQVICCQVHVDSDVVCAGGKCISSEGRVKLLLRETASSPMPQWNLLRLAIHECVGDEADATAMQMFLARQHAMMLVCDAATLEEDPCIERVCWWIKRAQEHTHHRRVFLVATCGDEFSENDREEIQSKLIHALKRRTDSAPLNNEEEEEHEEEELANEGVEGDRIFFVNLHSLEGVDALRDAMCKLLAQVVQPAVEATMPCRYARLGDLVDGLRERQTVISLAELAEVACRRLGFARLQEPASTTGAPREWTGESDMEMALELLHQRGEVFWFHKPAKLHEWVFLIPSFVANLVRYVWQPSKSVGALTDRGVLQLDMLPTLWEAEREVYIIGCAVLAELLAEFGILKHSLHHASMMGEDAQNHGGGLQTDAVNEEVAISPIAPSVASDVVTKDLDEEESTSFTDDLATTPVLESATPPQPPGVVDHGISQTTVARVERTISPRNVPIPLAAVDEFVSPQHEQSDTSLADAQTSSAASENPESAAKESVDGGDGTSESNEVADDEGSAKATVSIPATSCDRGERSSAAEAPATCDTELVGSVAQVCLNTPS